MCIGIFQKEKFNIVNNPADAEIIVINTCGFIESAKEEAINTILEMAEYKNYKCKYLIVMGCLVQRYYEDLLKNSSPHLQKILEMTDVLIDGPYIESLRDITLPMRGSSNQSIINLTKQENFDIIKEKN